MKNADLVYTLLGSLLYVGGMVFLLSEISFNWTGIIVAGVGVAMLFRGLAPTWWKENIR